MFGSSGNPKALKQKEINRGAEMFVLLNSCSQNETRNHLKDYYFNLLSISEPLLQKTLLVIMNQKKNQSHDGRFITERFLSQLFTLPDVEDMLTKKIDSPMNISTIFGNFYLILGCFMLVVSAKRGFPHRIPWCPAC